MDNFAQRRDRLLSGLPGELLDAYLISSPVNVSYLTGFSGESSHLVLMRDRAVLVSDPRFTEQLAEECPGLETHIRPPTKTTLAAVAEVIDGLGLRSVGFESTALSVADWETLKELLPAVQWKGAADRVERLRMVKDESEIKQIREAIAIAERAFTVLCALLRPDDSEIALCDALEGYVRRAGGRGTCFPSIIAVGPRSALPHAPPTGRMVGEKKPGSSASKRVPSAIARTRSRRRNRPSTTRTKATTPRYWSYDESKMSARGGAAASPLGAAIRSTIASSTWSTLRPVFAEIRTTCSGSSPIKSATSAAAPSGSAWGRSILFTTGTISRSFSIAR